MITELISNLENQDKATLIIGDIDFSKRNSQGSVIMKRLAKRFSLEKQIKKPTRPLYGEAIIDQIFTNSQIIKQLGTLDLSISDHVPIYINIKKGKTIFEKNTFTCKTYKNFNEEAFTNLLREYEFDQVLIQGATTDEHWDNTYNLIIKALDILAPLRTSTFSKSRPEWLTAELIEMMKDRDNAMKTTQRTKDLDDRKIERKLRNHTNSIIKLAKKRFCATKT